MLWELDCNSDESKAPVSLLKVAKLKEGMPQNCIVFREDSTIEIYTFQARQGQAIGITKPIIVFFRIVWFKIDTGYL